MGVGQCRSVQESGSDVGEEGVGEVQQSGYSDIDRVILDNQNLASTWDRVFTVRSFEETPSHLVEAKAPLHHSSLITL